MLPPGVLSIPLKQWLNLLCCTSPPYVYKYVSVFLSVWATEATLNRLLTLR